MTTSYQKLVINWNAETVNWPRVPHESAFAHFLNCFCFFLLGPHINYTLTYLLQHGALSGLTQTDALATQNFWKQLHFESIRGQHSTGVRTQSDLFLNLLWVQPKYFRSGVGHARRHNITRLRQTNGINLPVRIWQRNGTNAGKVFRAKFCLKSKLSLDKFSEVRVELGQRDRWNQNI